MSNVPRNPPSARTTNQLARRQARATLFRALNDELSSPRHSTHTHTHNAHPSSHSFTQVTQRHSSSHPSQHPSHPAPHNPSIHPQFRSKSVCTLFCKHCRATLCHRGMKAILLGNIKVELYSTDIPPKGVQLVWGDYTTPNCHCRIRDAACLSCGNTVGYHVTQGCNVCLKSCHNGHFWVRPYGNHDPDADRQWRLDRHSPPLNDQNHLDLQWCLNMFHSDGVGSYDRMDDTGLKPLKWASLPGAETDKEKSEDKRVYERCAR